MKSVQRGRLVEVHDVLADVVLRYFSARQPQAEVSLAFLIFNLILHFIVDWTRCKVRKPR